MRRAIRVASFLAPLFAAACVESAPVPPQAAQATAASATAASTASGTMAPDFTTRDVGGNTFRLSDHLGKRVILLNFWSTFCEPCKAEFPHIEALYARRKAKGLLVVGIAMDGPDTLADVPAFAKRYELTFPVVVDEDSRITSLYNPKNSAPLSVLIDLQGRVVRTRDGYNPGDEKLVEQDVDDVLRRSLPPK